MLNLPIVLPYTSHLPHTIYKLKEHRASVRVIVLVIPLPHSVVKLVPKTQPLLFHQDLEAPEGPVVAVQQQHGQAGELGRPVPAITTVNHYTGLVILHLSKVMSRQSSMNIHHLVSYLYSSSKDLLDMVQPVGGLQVTQPPLVIYHWEAHVLHLECKSNT